jgi:GLPGLI family protein
MKRKLIIITALVLSVLVASAQKPDTAQILVHYKFTHVRDTNNRASAYTENMVLFVGKNASSYKSYDRQLQNDLFRRQMQEAITNSADGNIRLDRHITGSGTEYYQFIANKKLVRREATMMDSYIIDDALPVINWHISSDKTNFAELHCQKATCHFKGRDYTAWFCLDLPVHVGPWKLNGLPGVIVEAYDAKKDVVFKFDRVEKAVLGTPKPIKDRHGRILPPLGDDDDNTDPNIIKVPTNGIKTTDKELTKLQNALSKDPNAQVQSMKAAAQSNGGPKTDISLKTGAPPAFNNPIELLEK